MKRLWSPLLFGLVIGVLVGNLVSSFGFQLIAQKDERMERLSHEPESSRRSDIQIATETASSPRDDLVPTAPPEEEYRDALYAIPPHLEIPTFFGPDPEDPEIRQLREQAALEFIESLETAGLSETELAEMKEALADLVDLQLTDFAPDDGSSAAENPMEDADHVAQSFTDAGESEELVQEVLDGLSQDLEIGQEMGGTPEEVMEREELDMLYRE